MVTKTYKCPIHGEFKHECSMDEELKECPTKLYEVPYGDGYIHCNKPVTRIFKTMTYLDSEGFVGKIYGTP